jgi:hypothetical protein
LGGFLGLSRAVELAPPESLTLLVAFCVESAGARAFLMVFTVTPSFVSFLVTDFVCCGATLATPFGSFLGLGVVETTTPP